MATARRGMACQAIAVARFLSRACRFLEFRNDLGQTIAEGLERADVAKPVPKIAEHVEHVEPILGYTGKLSVSSCSISSAF